MAKKSNPTASQPFHAAAAAAYVEAGWKGVPIPIRLLANEQDLQTLPAVQRRWVEGQGFKFGQRKPIFVANDDGSVAGVLIGAGFAAVSGQAQATRASDPMARAELIAGLLAQQLPPGRYAFASNFSDPEMAAIAWGLGAYRFRRYKSAVGDAVPQLAIPEGVDAARVHAIVEGTAFGRDLINTPASDMGPAEIEDAVRLLGTAHAAKVSSIVGDDLLTQNFPLIHAVGRASPRAPRLIDLQWKPLGASVALPRVTLVGKGIAFDTGGLDLKPSSGMLIMKKDMGGSAAVLATAHMIMSAKLPVQLRVLIAAAENSVAGNAFRPLDVIKSRAGLTVEIGNTDAEGRLVLADALALADEESPDILMTFATLTGAARVALGPDLPPFFADDDAFAANIGAAGLDVADPVWRLPFWTAYEAGLESPVADINNVAEGPFAGAVIAALFLRKFVKKAHKYAHFDIYGWRPAPKALGVKGGEVNAARAVFEMLATRYGKA
jgi:leucyl aminopeptidase